MGAAGTRVPVLERHLVVRRVGSMSTGSTKEDDLVLASNESSSYPNESELELGLGLRLGGGGGSLKSQSARILTAKDFPSMGFKSSAMSPPSISSSSSSSSPMNKANLSSGTKRTADSVSPSANSGVCQVVGWPPVRAYRMNSLVNQAKSPTTEEFHSADEQSKSKNCVVGSANSGSTKNNNTVKELGQMKTSLLVKVNMDGIPIGRKVDLSAHSCYQTLAQTLEDMFCRPNRSFDAKRSSMKEHDVTIGVTGCSKLLDGSSEFVLTYEDKEGDWMLVGDVPWGMFFSSVKRLRIMRASKANGLGQGFTK